jgi:hypothetical protein
MANAHTAMRILTLLLLLLFYLPTYLLPAVGFLLGGSSPYSSTDKINKNLYT